MAIRRLYKKKFSGVTWKSGHIYSFKYNAWENDPEPVIIFMYAFEGRHPKTGNQWRFIQGINFTYVPRGIRKKFASIWIKEWNRTKGNTRFTYDKMKRRYPGLKHATRRYMYVPRARIRNAKEIDFLDWEKAIQSTIRKDFSKKVRASLVNKFRAVMGRRKKRKKTKKYKPKSLRKI